jgi:hypothetical protein
MMYEQKNEAPNPLPYYGTMENNLQQSSAPSEAEAVPVYPQSGAKFDGYQNLGFVNIGSHI